MKKTKYAAMQKHCDALTKDGKQFSVTWDGGNDSGCFELFLDGKPINHPTAIEEEIIDRVAETIGYGSFAGDFSTQGTVIYDRVKKCFQGTDYCTELNNDTHPCAIPIRIPKKLWFDRLEIWIELDDADSTGTTKPKVTAQFTILNAPRIALHREWEKKLEKSVIEDVNAELNLLKSYAGVWEKVVIPFKDFKTVGNERLAAIKEFGYSYNECTPTSILVILNESIFNYETF